MPIIINPFIVLSLLKYIKNDYNSITYLKYTIKPFYSKMGEGTINRSHELVKVNGREDGLLESLPRTTTTILAKQFNPVNIDVTFVNSVNYN